VEDCFGFTPLVFMVRPGFELDDESESEVGSGLDDDSESDEEADVDSSLEEVIFFRGFDLV
jgi:hypothetical protein